MSQPVEDQPDVPGTESGDAENKCRPLRIWPPVLLLLIMLVARYVPVLIEDGPPNLWMASAFGPLLCSLLILLWWLALSRATAKERIVGGLGIVAAAGISLALIHHTMKGPAIMVLTIPMGAAAFAIGAILLAKKLSFRRTIVAVVLSLFGFGYSTLLRSDGMWGGSFAMGLHWRWVESAEEKMLAQRASEPKETEPAVSPEVLQAWLMEPEWPSFRGANRDGRYQGPELFADWSAAAPEEQWAVPVGPGWSSFCVAGNLLFTQEQRGDQEAVVCFTADSGSEVWSHEIASRFDDPLGGPGPRATPTLVGEAIFALGANGELMRLNAVTGELVWQKDLRKVAERDPPMWGFCSSPLVVDSTVIVHAGGKGDLGTIAFDAESGDVKWSAAAGEHSYSSPQLCTVNSENYIAVLSDDGLNLLEPTSGTDKLQYEWKHSGYRALQPQVIDGNSILLPTGVGAGTRCLRISSTDDGLEAEDLWTSRDLKPDFNDLVISQQHAFGFDGSIFTCIDLTTGKRTWKGGRYGKGQVLLLEASGLLVVAAESGELILLKVNAEKHEELAKIPGLPGKTWNHPVVVGDRLFIRNSEQARCLKLPVVEVSADRQAVGDVSARN